MNLKDKFVMVQGTTRYSGHVEDVFREEWRSHPETGQRVLSKLPPTEPGEGQVVAAVRLIRPLDTATERAREMVRPVLEDDDTQIAAVVYVPVDMLVTIPDALPASL